MGDRCYLELWVKLVPNEGYDPDEPDFEPEMSIPYELVEHTNLDSGDIEEGEGVSEGGFVKLTHEQYNYGFSGEMNSLKGSGVVLIGNHSSGGDYGAASFASDGKEVAYLYGEWGSYEVAFHEDGTPDPESLERVSRGIRLINKVNGWVHESNLEKLARTAEEEE